MKKLIVIIAIVFAISASGQSKYFTLIPSGFVNTVDSTNNFVIIPIEGKIQAELYKMFLNRLNALYVSPKDVLNPVENESISINGVAKSVIHGKNFDVFDINYTIIIQFKDGRIRVNSPSINKLSSHATHKDKSLFLNSGSDLLAGYTSIWNTEGKLVLPAAKRELEAFFNKFIDNLLLESKKAEEW